MKKIIIAISLMTISNCLAQEMSNYASRSLFSDYKANRVGDAVTIVVLETSQASNQAEKETGRRSGLSFNGSGTMDKEPMLPTMDFDFGSNNEFKGGGSTKTAGLVKAKISALIDSVLGNGLVRINGSRKITINGEEQVIKIKGLVRTSDINSGNMVYSFNISEAEIEFEGSGTIEDSQSPGWLTKFLHWIF